MAVPFNNIPGNIRVPFFYAEFASGGTPYQSNARLLLIGQKLATGSAVVNEPILVSDGQEEILFGKFSMLGQMFRAARKNAPVQEIWALPLADLAGGVLATGSLAVTAPAWTDPRIVSLYIAGERVRLLVQPGTTAAAVATALAAEINAANVSVTATAATTTVTLTARHKGTLGNQIAIDFGLITEDGPWASQILTITPMANGAGDPDFATALTLLGDDEYDWIASPYFDSTNLTNIGSLLSDVSGRWSWAKQTYGHYITQSAQTVGEFASSAANRNNQHMSVFPTKKFVSSPWTVVAALGAVVAQHLQSAPELSRPLQTLVLEGIIGPRSRGDQLSRSDRQSLYFYGVSGYHMRRDGTVAIDRIVTTYRTNAWGNPDWTYLDIETMAQSMFTIRYLRTYITNMFPRVALARENPDNNGAVVTPRDIRNAVVHAYSDLVSQGVMENPSAFADSLIVEINANDPTRVDVDLKLDHVNQLRIVATLAVNYLQRQNTALAA